MPPKCGTTTIAKMLNVDLHSIYDLSNINNTEYKKVIIIRKDIIDSFLSGFYEDLFNNTCYLNVDITFYEYLCFLYKCFIDKYPLVNNMDVYNKKNIPIWYGNCSNISLPITNSKGKFVSHIQSQKYAINEIVNLIKTNENVVIVEITKLSKYLNNNIIENSKQKIELDSNINFSNLSLSFIKNNRIIVNKDVLTNKQKEIILEMYDEDINFLEEKYNVF